MPATGLPYSVIHVSGPDAGHFLHNQLTRDIRQLHTGEHALAAWCDAKGRALCVMHLLIADDGFLLCLPASQVDTVIKRLRMYVLRARVDLRDASDDWLVCGTVATETLPAAAPDRRVGGHHMPFATTDGHVMLSLLPVGCEPAGTVSAERWRLAGIDAGLPELEPATSGRFLPQMLNLHWLHGVDFRKGCYPGQEVVARLHYRGRLTRRLFRMGWHGADLPQPGDAVVQADGTPQGTVVRAALSAHDAGRMLAVVALKAADTPLFAADGKLTPLPLPYAVDTSA